MTSPIARLLRVIPPGTHLVIGGTITLGIASYVQISVAGYGLDSDGRAAMSSLWSLVMTLTLGLFFPVEQEVTRIVAARAVRGEGTSPVLRRAGLLTLGLIAALILVMVLAAGPIADHFLKGETSLIWAFAAATAGMGLAYLTRGVLAGLGRFNAYGASLALDGGLRIVLALALLAAGVHSPLAYGLVLGAAPLLAVACTLPATLRGLLPGPSLRWSELFQNLSLMVGASLLAQGVANASVLAVVLLAPNDSDLQFAILNAGVLCRVPLFVFGSLQPTLMTGLSTTATSGDRPAFRKMLLQTLGVVGGLGLLGGIPAVLIGPWLIQVFFHTPSGVLGSEDLFWFSAGTLFYMIAMVLGQALLAVHRHRAQFLGWVLGTAALVGVTLVPGDVATRVELAYAVGSLVTGAAMLVALVRAAGRLGRSTSASVEAAAGTTPARGLSAERIR